MTLGMPTGSPGDRKRLSAGDLLKSVLEVELSDVPAEVKEQLLSLALAEVPSGKRVQLLRDLIRRYADD